MSLALLRQTRSATVGPVLTLVGGALMLLSFPLDWSTNGDASGDNPFHYPLTGGVAWIVVVALGAIAGARQLRVAEVRHVTPLIAVIAAGVASLLVLVRIVAGARTVDAGGTTVELDRGTGMWLALIASTAATVGTAITWLATRSRPPDPAGA